MHSSKYNIIQQKYKVQCTTGQDVKVSN